MKQLGIFILGALALALVQLCVAMFRRRGDHRPAADRLACWLAARAHRATCQAKAVNAAIVEYREAYGDGADEPLCCKYSRATQRLAGSAE